MRGRAAACSQASHSRRLVVAPLRPRDGTTPALSAVAAVTTSEPPAWSHGCPGWMFRSPGRWARPRGSDSSFLQGSFQHPRRSIAEARGTGLVQRRAHGPDGDSTLGRAHAEPQHPQIRLNRYHHHVGNRTQRSGRHRRIGCRDGGYPARSRRRGREYPPSGTSSPRQRLGARSGHAHGPAAHVG